MNNKNFLGEFSNANLCDKLIKSIEKMSSREVNIMEVCGTHTSSILKYGIKKLIPKNINLLSGPGCPVCVVDESLISYIIELSKLKDVIILSFGDMVKLLLNSYKERGENLKIIYSPLDSIDIALKNPDKKIVFVSIGFEATLPLTAITIIKAFKLKLKNLFFLVENKSISPAIDLILKEDSLSIDGFLLPGHVATIVGETPFKFIGEKYSIPSSITGFEPVDILYSINALLHLIYYKDPKLINCYKRAVKTEGNQFALKYIDEVFILKESNWRGLGRVAFSGFFIKEKYKNFDALTKFDIKVTKAYKNLSCKCSEVLRGKLSPVNCPQFNSKCTPSSPMGPCMISAEGACKNHFSSHCYHI